MSPLAETKTYLPIAPNINLKNGIQRLLTDIFTNLPEIPIPPDGLLKYIEMING